jgi:hypothetical protein
MRTVSAAIVAIALIVGACARPEASVRGDATSHMVVVHAARPVVARRVHVTPPRVAVFVRTAVLAAPPRAAAVVRFASATGRILASDLRFSAGPRAPPAA